MSLQADGGAGGQQVSGMEEADAWRRPGSLPPADPPLVAPAPAPAAAPAVEPAAAPEVPAPAPVAAPPPLVAGIAAPEPAEPRPPVPAPSPPVVAVPAPPIAPLLRAPLALIVLSVVVTLASSCFFVAEAFQISDAGAVGGAAHLTGTILAAAGNLVLALALAWVVVLLGRTRRG